MISLSPAVIHVLTLGLIEAEKNNTCTADVEEVIDFLAEQGFVWNGTDFEIDEDEYGSYEFTDIGEEAVFALPRESSDEEVLAYLEKVRETCEVFLDRERVFVRILNMKPVSVSAYPVVNIEGHPKLHYAGTFEPVEVFFKIAVDDYNSWVESRKNDFPAKVYEFLSKELNASTLVTLANQIIEREKLEKK